MTPRKPTEKNPTIYVATPHRMRNSSRIEGNHADDKEMNQMSTSKIMNLARKAAKKSLNSEGNDTARISRIAYETIRANSDWSEVVATDMAGHAMRDVILGF